MTLVSDPRKRGQRRGREPGDFDTRPSHTSGGRPGGKRAARLDPTSLSLIPLRAVGFFQLFKIAWLVGLGFWLVMLVFVALAVVNGSDDYTFNDQVLTGLSGAGPAVVLVAVMGGLANTIVAGVGAGVVTILAQHTGLGGVMILTRPRDIDAQSAP